MSAPFKPIRFTFLMTLGFSLSFSLYMMCKLFPFSENPLFSYGIHEYLLFLMTWIQMIFFCMIAPIIFIFLWAVSFSIINHTTLVVIGIIIACCISVHFGSKRTKLRFLLPLSALMWSGLGAYSTHEIIINYIL